jgi:hypothetical protein
MAALQVRQELMSSAAAEGSAEGAAPAPLPTLQAFWLEQGLKRHEAERLARELLARELPLSQLSAQVQRLQRVLPGVDVAQLVYKECGLLFAPAPLLVNNLVVLIQLGFRDVVAMVTKQPGLLLLEDLAEAAERAIGQLAAVHPSRSRQVVADILEESPALVARMQYYLQPGLALEELPIEIQNAMVLGDHGIGFLFKYYRGQLQAAGHPDRATGFEDEQRPPDAQ